MPITAILVFLAAALLLLRFVRRLYKRNNQGSADEALIETFNRHSARYEVALIDLPPHIKSETHGDMWNFLVDNTKVVIHRTRNEGKPLMATSHRVTRFTHQGVSVSTLSEAMHERLIECIKAKKPA